MINLNQQRAINKLFVYCSSPFVGLEPEAVRDEHSRLLKVVESRLKASDSHVLVSERHNLVNDHDGELVNVARGLQVMSHADLVIFTKDWLKCRTCRLEHEACIQFEIPFLEED